MCHWRRNFQSSYQNYAIPKCTITASLHKEAAFEVCDINILEKKSKEAIMHLKYTETESRCKDKGSKPIS